MTFVKGLNFAVVLLVQLLELLFFRSAEKNSASQWPAGVGGAARADLVGASPPAGAGGVRWGAAYEQRQFNRRQIKPMVEQVELAAVPAAQADGSGSGDGAVGVRVGAAQFLHHSRLGAASRYGIGQARLTG